MSSLVPLLLLSKSSAKQENEMQAENCEESDRKSREKERMSKATFFSHCRFLTSLEDCKVVVVSERASIQSHEKRTE